MRVRLRRSSRWSRAAEWFAVAWALVALVGPVAFPTVAALAPPRAMDVPCVGAMHGGAPRVVHGRAQSSSQSSSHGTDHGCCSCFGPCCHAAPAVFARAPRTPDVPITEPVVRAGAPAVVVAYHPTAPEHARPPSVGPPRSHSV